MRNAAQEVVGQFSPAVPRLFETIRLRLLIAPTLYVFFWIAAGVLLRAVESRFFVPSGYADADFLLAGILALFLRRRWIPLLVTMVVSIDVLDCFARTYYFGPLDIPYALASVLSFPAYRIAAYAILMGVVLLGLILPAFVLRRTVLFRSRWGVAIALVIIACFLKGLDKWGDYRLRAEIDAASTHRLLRIPERGLLLQVQVAARQHRDAGLYRQDHPLESATARGLRLLAPSALHNTNIVDVLVESWGLDQRGSINNKLLAFYNSPDIQSRYQVLTGSVPFTGGTVAGETRELCSSSLGLAITHAPASVTGDCIPYDLRRQGYRTESVHGYVSHMFERYRWHPTIGFEQSWFLKDLHREGLSNCLGAFPGVCDAQIAQWIGNHLIISAGTQPDFLFWITLNSHLPVPSSTEGLNPVACDFDPQVDSHEPMCAWFKIEFQVHSSIAELASRSDLPPTAFFIIGDHAPPFQDPEMRSRFSQSVVPYVLLIPRTSEHQNAPVYNTAHQIAPRTRPSA